MKRGLGGRVRVILSGAAPLSNHVEEFLRVVTCSHVLQGYGLLTKPFNLWFILLNSAKIKIWVVFRDTWLAWLPLLVFFCTGLTETCAGSFVSLPNNMSMLGTVGPPVPYVEVRLESVPEMGYDALSKESPRGEICIRGDTLFSGYYKREDLTKEVLIDGWFHTGMMSQSVKNGKGRPTFHRHLRQEVILKQILNLPIQGSLTYTSFWMPLLGCAHLYVIL